MSSREQADTLCAGILSTGENGTLCRCSHLTDFATYFLNTYAESRTIVSEYKTLTPRTLRENFGACTETRPQSQCAKHAPCVARQGDTNPDSSLALVGLMMPSGIVLGLGGVWFFFALLLIKTRRDQGREMTALLMALRDSDIYVEVLSHVRSGPCRRRLPAADWSLTLPTHSRPRVVLRLCDRSQASSPRRASQHHRPPDPLSNLSEQELSLLVKQVGTMRTTQTEPTSMLGVLARDVALNAGLAACLHPVRS